VLQKHRTAFSSGTGAWVLGSCVRRVNILETFQGKTCDNTSNWIREVKCDLVPCHNAYMRVLECWLALFKHCPCHLHLCTEPNLKLWS